MFGDIKRICGDILRGFFSRNCQKNFRLSLGIKLPEST